MSMANQPFKNGFDSSFPSIQFHLEGFATPYRLDRYANGSVIRLHIRENIPSTLLNSNFSIVLAEI